MCLSFVATLYPFSQVLYFSPWLLLLHSLLMVTCLSIIDILTGLTSRPPVAPLSSSLPYFTRVLMRHTHTNVQVCVWDKSCDNLECLLRGVCLRARVCVQASQTETGRLSESPQAARAEFLYLGPYKRLFPASNCAYTSLSNTLFSQVFHLRPSQLCGAVSMCLVCTYMQLHIH